MKNYEDIVATLARENSSEFVDNSSPEHAAVLIRNMLNYATKTVDLFTGCLATSVYEKQEIKEAGKSFLTRGGKLRIVIQEDVSQDALNSHEFLNALKCSAEKGQQDNFKVFKLSNELREKTSAHFLVMDNKGFRYEPTKDGKNEAKAIACFNNGEMASSLSELFNALVKKSKPMQLA